MVLDCDCVRCGMLKVTNIFLNMVKKKQLLDLELCKKKLLRIDKAVEFRLGDDDVLKFKGCVCTPRDQEIKKLLLEEIHKSKLCLHPDMTKMYQYLKMFWWLSMKWHSRICHCLSHSLSDLLK